MVNMVKSKKIRKNFKKIDVILTPAIGGIIIGYEIGKLLKKETIFCERVNGRMKLRRGFSIAKGQRIVIVEDIITTGGSVAELIELVEQQGAEIIHVVNLVDRSSVDVDFGVPSTALLTIPSESWEPENCVLCKQGMEITHRGRTGKKLETV